ncbi:N-acetylmuramoyl-L-alanine amidase [Streptomyces sp. NPDC006610]|uniref:N-acetylmuramoyl-L-alanine amidase n=1 Tax=Streptomyces sp. NPDC006610 TaxID=3154584 RepID=UPI00339F407E
MSPRSTRAYKPLSLKRRAWLTIGAVALSGAGIVTYAIAEPPADSGGGAGREPSVRTLKLQDRGAGRKGLAKRETDRFSAVVLTWNDPDARAKGTPQVRTRDAATGAWSGWQTLSSEPHQADGAEGGRIAARGGTESVWTGESDGVEVRLVNAGGAEAGGQPAGMDVKLLDPGTDPADAMTPAAFAAETATPDVPPEATDSATPTPTEPVPPAPTEPATDSATPTQPQTDSPAPTEPSPTDSASPTATPSPTPSGSPTVPAPVPSTVVKPPIITQAQWGAAVEYNGTPEYGTQIKAAALHHTGVDNDNKLSCAQSAARLRTIQQAHIQQGYFDLGYNFVVDRCGQIFEGRSGGVDLPVTGAHDIGFNTDTVGISYIGNFETAKPTRAGLDAIARIVAWKFGMYGVDPTGRVSLQSGVAKGVKGNMVEKGQSIELPRVFGHYATNNTACPGDHLIAKLDLVRRLAKAPGVSHALATSDFDRNGISDLVAGVPKANAVTVVPGGVDGPVLSAKRTLTQNSSGVPGTTESGDGFGTATAWGDVTGDGHADLVIGAPGEDDSSGHTDRGQVTVMYGPTLAKGYSFSTTGVKATGAKLGSTVAAGDFNADGKADVFAAGAGNGGTFHVRLTGGATTTGPLTTATGPVAYLDSATGDFNRDGYADVALNYRDGGGTGRVVRFAGSASGLTKAGVLSVRGGRSIAAGDVHGNGYDDIVIGQPVASESGAKSGGQITLVPGSSTGFTTTGMAVIHQDTPSVIGANESGDNFGAAVSLGDHNADGYLDVLAGVPGENLTRAEVNRINAGGVTLIRGTSSGLTGTGSVMISQDTSGIPGSTETDDRVGSSVTLTDLSGYGRADLTFGADGEDGSNGVLLHVPSNSTGLGYADALSYSRTMLGMPTAVRLGQTLTP